MAISIQHESAHANHTISYVREGERRLKVSSLFVGNSNETLVFDEDWAVLWRIYPSNHEAGINAAKALLGALNAEV